MLRLMTVGLAGDLEVLAGKLPRRLDGLGAAGGEEDAIAVARGESGQPVGQLHGHRMGVAPYREVGQGGGLSGRGLGQLGAAVADLAGEQPGQPVEVALAVLVVDVDALSSHDDRNLIGVRHAGEVHPQVAMGALLECLGGKVGHLVPQL
jgi:hypothetical protein